MQPAPRVLRRSSSVAIVAMFPRRFSSGIAAASFVMACFATEGPVVGTVNDPVCEGPVVGTVNGPVCGVDNGAGQAWLGIPYVEAPIGARRFRSPSPLARTWQEALLATQPHRLARKPIRRP